MFKCQHQTLQSLCYFNGPLSGLGDSIACVLTTDEQYDWSYTWIEVAIDDKVSLFPSFGSLIVIVIEYLIKPELFLFVDDGIFGILVMFLLVNIFLSGLQNYENKEQQENSFHRDQNRFIYQRNGVYQQLNLFRMDPPMLDMSKIPKFQFEVHNEELMNCIKELHFQSKTQEKNIQKIKKDIQLRPLESIIVESFTIMNSNIDIDATLLKQIATRSEGKQQESGLKNASNKLGNKIGQVSEVLKLLFDKVKDLEKRLDTNHNQSKVNLNERVSSLQSQLQELKKSQNKQNRLINQNLQLNINTYEEKLREVESKTLWQINDCKTKLGDRVNEQFVRDVVKEAEARITTKVKQSLVKNNIEPQRIDKLESRCLKIQKEINSQTVELNSRIEQVKQKIEHSLATKKDLNQQKLDIQKKLSNMQVQMAEISRNFKSQAMDIVHMKEDTSKHNTSFEQLSKEVGKIGKMVANLKLSDDFQKLMQNLDPHKICEIDTTLVNLAEKDLKIQRQLDAMKRYQQKLKEKVQICNLLTPNDGKDKLNKQEVSKIFIDLLSTNATFKKIQSIEGQLFQFRAYGDMINEINKRISKIQKQFDIQGVMYGLKGLEEYIKKELLIMNTKISQFESMMAEEKRRRPISARKTTDGKLSSTVSVKKLMPVDCISCFQNPGITLSPQQKKLFGSKY